MLCVCIYCVVTISILSFFFWLILHGLFFLKSSRIQNNNKSHETALDLNRPIAMITAYCSWFFPLAMMTILSRHSLSLFVCFTHVKIIIKHHCDKQNNAWLARLAGLRWLVLGSFVLFIAFVRSFIAHIVVLHIFIFHHQVLSSRFIPLHSCFCSSKSCGESGIY